MTQFARNLEELLGSANGNQESDNTDKPEEQSKETELNLLSVVAVPVLKRFAIPIAGVAIVLFMIIRYLIL